MIKHSISLGLLLTAGILGQPAVAADYGCPAGAPAERVASDYNRRWLDALETGDPEHLRELYSDNAVIMPPTDETIIGRDPIGEYMATTPSAPPLSNYSVDIVACELAGDTVQFAGVWGADQTDYRGHAVAMTGNVLRILARQADGSWTSSYEIWN
jgi:ketosteroid isomerase-like protein